MDILRSAWRRLVKVVLMPDDVMGRSAQSSPLADDVAGLSAVQYAESGSTARRK